MRQRPRMTIRVFSRLGPRAAVSACLAVSALVGPAPGTAQSSRQDVASVSEATFDSAWSRIANTHFDPEMGGVDWDAVRAELRPRALAAESPDSLRAVLTDMLARLGESHFALIPSTSAEAFEGREGSEGGADPGLTVRWMEGSLVVTTTQSL